MAQIFMDDCRNKPPMTDIAAAAARPLSKSRARAIKLLVPFYFVVMTSVPAIAAGLLLEAAPAGPIRFLFWAAAVPLACLTFAFTCALLSIPTQRAIVSGRFPRNLGHHVYGPRRLYALCWTSLYYCSPIYHAILAIPILKRAIFRLFGYKGSLAVQIYPDTWLRDLPLLDLHDGAYLSNKSTIGTNMCLTGGDVIVEPIRVERGAMVGHMVMLGPGCRIREGAEIGVGAGIGIHVDIGANAKIGPCVIINHGARVGKNAEIGLGAYIGLRAVIGDGLNIPNGLVIPDRAKVRTVQDLSRYVDIARSAEHIISISDASSFDLPATESSATS